MRSSRSADTSWPLYSVVHHSHSEQFGDIADGSIGTPSLFDVENRRSPARNLELMSIEERRGDIVWLRYKVRR